MLKQLPPTFINGPAGPLEAAVHLIEDAKRIAIICHPNPLQEGTMDNKVVTTTARALNMKGITAVRFNYRGVGQSAGQYGNITGEVADCLAVVAWAKEQWPGLPLWLAGFSFGAYIAADVAAGVSTEQLISIAPSVDRMPYSNLPPIDCPWLVIQGEEDEVVDPNSVFQWYAGLKAQKTLVRFPQTGHFFHGKLIELREAIMANTID